jgi:hypothetical protein
MSGLVAGKLLPGSRADKNCKSSSSSSSTWAITVLPEKRFWVGFK